MTALDTLNPTATVGQLVTERPGRSRVFQRLGIDFCCGGNKPLGEVVRARGLDLDRVLNELRANDQATPVTIRPADMTLTELCDHIERTHHAYLKEELPRLGAMVRKVAAVHGQRYPWMLEVDGVYAGFAAEMESHMMKEEQMLFRFIRALDSGEPAPAHACGPGVGNPIRVMEHEHDDAGRALARMRELSDNYTPPADACNTFRAAIDGLAQLEADTHEHVHLENNVLFPRAIEREAA